MDDGIEDDAEIMYVEDIDEVIEVLGQDEDPEGGERDPKEDAVYVFTGHTKPVFCGSLTKDGKLAVTGDENDIAYLWDTSNGNVILECTGHKDSVTYAEFNHDESYLATGDMGGIIQVWRLSDKKNVWDYAMGDCTWMKWHIAANVLLAGSAEGDVYMWKIPDGTCKMFKGYGHRSDTAAMFPDGQRIVVGYADGTLRIIELKTSNVLATVSPKFGHSATITTLACHADNNLMLSADVNGKTILSTASSGKIVSVLQSLGSGDTDGEGDNWVEAAAFCKDPVFPVAATGTVNGQIFLWDIPKQVLRHKIEQESGVSKLAWKGNTSILLSAGLDGILRCYDAKNGQYIRSFEGHSADILDVSISANGEKVLTTSDDSTARIFDVTS